MQSHVLFVCVSERRKLRVKVLTAGYMVEANCQFPRDVRAEGVYYKAKASDVRMVCTRGMYYYSVNRAAVEVLGPNAPDAHELHALAKASSVVLPEPLSAGAAARKIATVFQDDGSDECCICMSEAKNVVFNCGHLYTCKGCSTMVHNCPICRQRITMRIGKELFG